MSPDPDRAEDRMGERQHERTERVEDVLDGVREDLGDRKYPVTSEELAMEYADQPLDMPNETETLGSVFDRLVDEEYDSPEEVREAVYRELTGEAEGPEEYNEQRDLEQIDEVDGKTETDWQ
ncbi:DUF5789 family protein [Halomarina pelagica]|uniref:DUF5789 family protein n=1 Tax=Halomarina pelagica TaxID=2961599 RepID=UPI0020C1CDFD|nr:hypothetical protein [Halomarina sp. BND7]